MYDSDLMQDVWNTFCYYYDLIMWVAHNYITAIGHLQKKTPVAIHSDMSYITSL